MTDAPTSNARLSFDYELEAPPEKVWRALTVPALRDHWLEPAPAGVIAELVEAEPPSRLRWSWQEAGAPADLVTFTLSPNGAGGTLLRLVHERQAVQLPMPANGNRVLAMAA